MTFHILKIEVKTGKSCSVRIEEKYDDYHSQSAVNCLSKMMLSHISITMMDNSLSDVQQMAEEMKKQEWQKGIHFIKILASHNSRCQIYAKIMLVSLNAVEGSVETTKVKSWQLKKKMPGCKYLLNHLCLINWEFKFHAFTFYT